MKENEEVRAAQAALLEAVREHALLCAQMARLEEKRRAIAAVAVITNREIGLASDRARVAFETLRQAHIAAANAEPLLFEV